MQVAELLAGVAAPILYWEQGHEWLFGDPIRFQVSHTSMQFDLASKLGDLVDIRCKAVRSFAFPVFVHSD